MKVKTIEVVVYEAYEERGECAFFASEELAEELAPKLLKSVSSISKALVNLSLKNITEIMENGYTWG